MRSSLNGDEFRLRTFGKGRHDERGVFVRDGSVFCALWREKWSEEHKHMKRKVGTIIELAKETKKMDEREKDAEDLHV
jgi:hypothetical protein